MDFVRGNRQDAKVVNDENGRCTRNPEVDYFERVDGRKVGKTDATSVVSCWKGIMTAHRGLCLRFGPRCRKIFKISETDLRTLL